MTNSALDGKPYAGNPHVRIDEGDGASAKPRRSSLLYIRNYTWLSNLNIWYVILIPGIIGCVIVS